MNPSIEQEIRDLHALLGSAQDLEGRAFVPLADAYRRAGDPDRALEVLDRGLERHPDLAAGYLMRALACRDLADDAGAEAAYRQVLGLDADNARALVGLGRLMRGAGDDEEAERMVQRGVALDSRLASEGTPDRVPRHSTNPEILGPEALAPLEREVLELAAEAPAPAAEVDDASAETEIDPLVEPDIEPAVTDLADVEPAAGLDDEVAPGPDEPHLRDAQAALLSALAPLPEFDGSDPIGGGLQESLDIEWEVEEFYRSIPGEPEPAPALSPERPEVEVEVEVELVLDAWSLAPDGWTAEAGAPVPPADVADPPEAEHELPIDLADLAPELPDESLGAMDDLVAPLDLVQPHDVIAPAEDGGDDAVLPTRTLGELYARQGLTTEAIQVFRALAGAEPTNLEHRARLIELEAGLAAGGRAPVTPAMNRRGPGAAGPDEPPISSFFETLLGWESGKGAEGES